VLINFAYFCAGSSRAAYRQQFRIASENKSSKNKTRHSSNKPSSKQTKARKSLEFQTSKHQAELLDFAHEAIARRLSGETSEERQGELRALLKRKIGKKGAGED
jgi:hypothetical protein